MVYVCSELCARGERNKWKDGTMTAVCVAKTASYSIALCWKASAYMSILT